MIDNTNPCLPATLFARVVTDAGPRIIIQGGLSVRDAKLMADVLNLSGIYTEVVEERARATLVSMLAKIKRQTKKEFAVVPRAVNVTPITQARKGRGA